MQTPPTRRRRESRVAAEEGRPRGRGRSRRRASPRTQLGSRLSALLVTEPARPSRTSERIGNPSVEPLSGTTRTGALRRRGADRQGQSFHRTHEPGVKSLADCVSVSCSPEWIPLSGLRHRHRRRRVPPRALIRLPTRAGSRRRHAPPHRTATRPRVTGRGDRPPAPRSGRRAPCHRSPHPSSSTPTHRPLRSERAAPGGKGKERGRKKTETGCLRRHEQELRRRRTPLSPLDAHRPFEEGTMMTEHREPSVSNSRSTSTARPPGYV